MEGDQPMLTAAECKEMQCDELNALKAIFFGKINDLRGKQAWKVFHPLELQISLSPSEGESNNKMYVSVDLYVKCSAKYPADKPYIEIRNPVGIGNQQVGQLTENLRRQTEKLIGRVMIYELCSQVRAFLHCHNKPPKESFYAEMMKEIKQKEKDKEDEKKKMEQEKEQHEKLQAETIKHELKKKQEEVKKEKKKKRERLESKMSLETIETDPPRTPPDKQNRISDDDDDASIEDDLRMSMSEHDIGFRLQSEFRVWEKLGHGAFGDVLKVQNLLDGCFYAIKRIPLNSRNKTKTKEITREVKFLSRLTHNNVVRYFNSWIETSFKEAKPSDCDSSKDTTSCESHPVGSPRKRVHLNSSLCDSASDDSIDSLHDDSVDDVMNGEEESDSVVFQRSGTQGNVTSEDLSKDVSSAANEEKEILKVHFLYIQMEFCNKSTLRDCINNGLYKDKQLVWLLFKQIIEGLVHIHDQGIIHRDLKPANIFLDSQSHIKIGDFGLAAVASKSLEQTSQELHVVSKESSHNSNECLTSNVGTALYISPEMTTSKQPYNQKVDLYSLGIIFFEMCYKTLETGMERSKVLSLVRQAAIQFPQDIDIIVEPLQKQILLWLLNHDPSKRPTAKELLESEPFPLLSSEKSNVEKTLTSVVKNVNSHEHKTLMSAIFSQTNSENVDNLYDYMPVKGFNFSKTHELNVLRQHIVGILEKIFRRHGAQCFDVSTLTPHQRIYPDSCEEVLLMNKSGTIVSLPYDSRVNFARYVGRRNISDVRRYFIGKIYREHAVPDLQPKELWECSFDVVASSGDLKLNYDAEVVMIAQEIFNELPGFADKEYQLKLNHINFITVMMNFCDIPSHMHQEILLIFRESKDIGHQKSQLTARLSNLGIRESDIKKFFGLVQKEDSLLVVSNFLRSLPGIKEPNLSLVVQGVEYFKNLLDILKACNSKFQVVFSLQLCNNFNVYSGLSFQISRRCNKKLEVLAIGGSYDSFFGRFRQLEGNADAERRGVGISMSLDKILSTVRSSQTLKEGKNFCSPLVQFLVSSTRPKEHSVAMQLVAQILWSLGLSSKLYDGHDCTLQSLKNFCMTDCIPYLVVVDKQNQLIKIESFDNYSVIHKEVKIERFKEFLKRRLLKESDLNVSLKNVDHSDRSFDHAEQSSVSSCEVKLVGSTNKYKDSSKVLANVADDLVRFSDRHVVVFVVDVPKEVVMSVNNHVKLKDEASFLTSMKPVLKECTRHKKHIQWLADDIVSKRFRTDQNPVVVLYSIEDEYFRVIC